MASATALEYEEYASETGAAVRHVEEARGAPGRSRVTPKHRVVLQQPVGAPARRRQRSFSGLTLMVITAGLLLLVYVLFWVLALRGGYYREELRERVAQARLDQAELAAEKNRLRSTGLILRRAATELGMSPAADREYQRLPQARQVAREAASR